MKTILLDDQFTIQVKTASYLLVKTGAPKEVVDTDSLEVKTVIPKEVWYYISIEQALRNYAEKVLEQSEDIKDLLKKVQKVESTIKNINLK